MMCSSTCVVMFPNPLWKQQQRPETKSSESEKGAYKNHDSGQLRALEPVRERKNTQTIHNTTHMDTKVR